MVLDNFRVIPGSSLLKAAGLGGERAFWKNLACLAPFSSSLFLFLRFSLIDIIIRASKKLSPPGIASYTHYSDSKYVLLRTVLALLLVFAPRMIQMDTVDGSWISHHGFGCGSWPTMTCMTGHIVRHAVIG